MKHCTGGGDQNDLKGKEMQEGKVVVRDKYLRKEEKSKTGEKGRDILN